MNQLLKCLVQTNLNVFVFMWEGLTNGMTVPDYVLQRFQ
ncbi:hypothetical protein ACVQ92_09220 [Staphylococcus aureus]